MANNRSEFKKLAMTRLDDAKVLLKNRRDSAAYYLAGYAVECALKACLAKKTRQYHFPPEPETVRKRYYTHDLQILAKECGLSDVLEKGDPQLAKYWTSIKDWSERSRYDPHAGILAKDILRAVDDPASGVFQCIKRYW
jgi:HEPN domain-containing protein